MHRLSVLAILVLMISACSGGASQAERRACGAAEGLLAANDREAVRARVAEMKSSAAGENDTLSAAASDFEEALDDQSQERAEDAIGRFYAECERLNLKTPGD